MVRPGLRSRTLRRVKRKAPGARVSLQYKIRKADKPICAQCKSVLHGVAHGIPSKARNATLSGKRPSRPYGGMLCSPCMRKKQIAKARSA